MRTLIIGFTIFFIVFKVNAQSRNEFIVKGIIDTVPHATYYVTYKTQGNKVADTISLDDNRKFQYKGTILEPTVFNMTIKNSYNKNLVGDLYIYSFWVEPGKIIELRGHTGWLVMGARGLVSISNKFDIKNSILDSIEKKYIKDGAQAFELKRKQLGRELNNAEAIQTNYDLLDRFISQEPNNYYGLYKISQNINGSIVDSDFFKKMYHNLSKALKETYLGKEISLKIMVPELTSIGKILPFFEQTDTASKIVKLSDFRGKYVLVDFWASWCGPCRKEHPLLIEAYQQYRSKNFEIIGVSIDSDKQHWLKAIQDDGLSWTQLSDLKGLNNSIARQFNITGVPENFLIDPNGVIIAKGLKGQDLLNKLEILLD